jgi:GTPase SAR1 family protein
VIIFGESGVGKSSIVNMLCGSNRAKVGNGARGTTFEHQSYEVDNDLNIYDTAGLNETKFGTVPAAIALKNLYELVSNLESGVSLLVFVMRGRITDAASKNYKLFWEGLCQENVPIVICVTGLEEMEDLDQWWNEETEADFREEGMLFRNHACITSTKGRLLKKGQGFVYQEEYDGSIEKVKELIAKNLRWEPWQKPNHEWREDVVSTFVRYAKHTLSLPIGDLSSIFVEYLGMDVKEANRFAYKCRVS